MFKKLLYKHIQKIKKLYERMDDAYQQTYTDKTAGRQLNEKIEKRKQLNKQKTLNRITELLTAQFHKETGGSIIKKGKQKWNKINLN